VFGLSIYIKELKMETKTINTYKFNELSENAQEHAIEKFRENKDFDSDWIIEQLVDDIKEQIGLDLDKDKLEWEMMSRTNQMSLKSEYVVKLLGGKYQNLDDLDIPNKFGVYTNYLGGGLASCLLRSDIREDCAILEDNEEIQDLEKTLISKQIYEDLIKLQDLIYKAYNNLCEEYNYQMSDECIKEEIEINEYDFDEDGEWI
jgi:hypothetical protein